MMADTYDHYDVIIVGAGLVGLTLAAALGGTAYDVLVIDARSQPATREPPVLPVAAGNSDFVLTGGALGGVLAINPASTAILRRLDVWDRLPADAVCAYDAMHVWDGEGTGSIDFAAADIGRDALGHVVETAVLLDALEARVRGLPNVTLQYAFDVQAVTAGDDVVVVTGSDAAPGCRLLVGADGKSSRIRELAGLGERRWSYGQTAVVATLAVERPHQGTALQVFTDVGPLAFLPLVPASESAPSKLESELESDLKSEPERESEGESTRSEPARVSLVWSMETADATAFTALSAEAQCDRLSRASEHVLGVVTGISPTFSFELEQRHARRYVSPRIALLGDAAHTIHPLAGQGANLGFADASALATRLTRAELTRADPGQLATLKNFERERQPENLATMAVVEAFRRVYGNRNPVAALLCNEAMKVVAGTPLLRRQVVKLASGR